MRGNRAVVDDASAARLLLFHQPESALRTQKRAGQVDVNDGFPLLDRDVFKVNTHAAHAGIVEQHIKPAKGLPDTLKQCVDRLGAGHIGGHGQGAIGAAFAGNLLQWLRPAANQHHTVAGLQQPQRHGFANAGARAGHQCYFVVRIHGIPLFY